MPEGCPRASVQPISACMIPAEALRIVRAECEEMIGPCLAFRIEFDGQRHPTVKATSYETRSPEVLDLFARGHAAARLAERGILSDALHGIILGRRLSGLVRKPWNLTLAPPEATFKLPGLFPFRVWEEEIPKVLQIVSRSLVMVPDILETGHNRNSRVRIQLCRDDEEDLIVGDATPETAEARAAALLALAFPTRGDQRHVRFSQTIIGREGAAERVRSIVRWMVGDSETPHG